MMVIAHLEMKPSPPPIQGHDAQKMEERTPPDTAASHPQINTPQLLSPCHIYGRVAIVNI